MAASEKYLTPSDTAITNKVINAGGVTKIAVVTSLPATPDANTLYIIKA